MYSRSSVSRWGVRLLTFATWALLAGSAAYWLLQRPPRMADAPATADAGTLADAVDPERVARALGAAGPQAPVVTRTAETGNMQLLGVLTQGHGGAALVSVDGGPARPVRVGQSPPELDGEWVLHAVAPHAAVFAAGDEQLELQMPPMEERSRAGDAVAPERAQGDTSSTVAPTSDAAARARSISERRERLLQRRAAMREN